MFQQSLQQPVRWPALVVGLRAQVPQL
jgi:hypothetical protein